MRVPIITRGTRGVDMKVNPLTLGANKLRSATNLVFDEGGIKTRPQFSYESLGVRGQFQGAAEYNLAEGISSQSFGIGSGIALVVDGKVSVGCEVVGDLYSCSGNVNIYDAENYIIFQNANSHTYWWNGTSLVKSPGTIEEHWDDPETDFNEQDLTTPVADIPDCLLPETNINLVFNVIDSTNRLPITGASIVVRRNSIVAYEGDTDENGKITFNPHPRDYTYTVEKEGFSSIDVTPLSVVGTPEFQEFDPCFDPRETVGGTQGVLVVINKIPDVDDLRCPLNFGDVEIRLPSVFDPHSYDPTSVTTITLPITNVGEDPITVRALTMEDVVISDISPPLPVEIRSGGAVNLTITKSAMDFFDSEISVTTANKEDTTLGTCTIQIPSAADYVVLIGNLIPLEINWETETTDDGSPVASRWTTANNGRTIRYEVEDSVNCEGTNDSIQRGTAQATITVGSEDVNMELAFSGIAEVQDTGFELITFILDGETIATATSPGDNTVGETCDMAAVIPNYMIPSPHILLANTTHTLGIEFTTNDTLFHVGAFYEANLFFTAVP